MLHNAFLRDSWEHRSRLCYMFTFEKLGDLTKTLLFPYVSQEVGGGVGGGDTLPSSAVPKCVFPKLSLPSRCLPTYGASMQ